MTFLIPMSQKELNRYDIIKRLIRKEINGSEAANLLTLSTRQIRRLKSKVKEKGRITFLLHRHYYDFGPTLAKEKLTEIHHIVHDPKTIRQIMIDEKLWQPKTKRQKSEYRSWRQRKSNFGEMVQFDGSYEHWFEDRADKCCLLAAIDDATGRIIKAKFAQDEGVFPVFNFWLEYLEKQGKPHSIYLDKFSTYKMTRQVALENHDLKTQFQRALEELQIEPIFAN